MCVVHNTSQILTHTNQMGALMMDFGELFTLTSIRHFDKVFFAYP